MPRSDRPDPPEIGLDAVLATAELARRPWRAPDHEAEARALSALAEALAAAPQDLLQRLVDLALGLCRADSTGISILEPGEAGGEGRFRWPAVAGLWARFVGFGVPQDASPCGVVIARDTPLLFAHPERLYPDAVIDPRIVEILLVPFHDAGRPVGTVWAVAHTPDRKFDAEDARLLGSLARFASAAYRLIDALDVAEAGRTDLGRRVEERTRELSDANVSLRREAAERGRAEEARGEAEDRFRLLVENVRDHAIFFLDAGGRVASWNAGAERHLGYRAEEVLGDPPDRFYIAEDRARGLPEHELEVAITSGRAGDDNWMVRKDGSRFWASGSTTALKDASGNLRGFGKILRDLTRQRAAEEAIREGQERLRLALSAARMGIWTWDVADDVHVRDANLNRLLGLGPVETSQTSAGFLDHIHPDDRPAVRSAFASSASLGRPLNVEFRVVWPDGSVRWLRDQGDVVRRGDGAPPRLAGACVDITDLKDAEAALRRARDELEDRVAARTAELALVNGSLRAEVAERRRVEVDRAKLLRLLVTVEEDERRRVSRDLHDRLGQDLTGLILGLKALEGDLAAGAPGRPRLRELQELVARIGRETHDMAVDLRPTALDDIGLDAALRTLVDRWSVRTGIPADFHFHARGAARFPPDAETTIYRVVQEALTNVAKHAGAGRVSVIVERTAGDAVAIVEDDGRGFDPEGDGGLGRLGLLGMRERVSLAGGSLQVESSPGVGTTVRARVPVATSSEESDHA